MGIGVLVSIKNRVIHFKIGKGACPNMTQLLMKLDNDKIGMWMARVVKLIDI